MDQGFACIRHPEGHDPETARKYYFFRVSISSDDHLTVESSKAGKLSPAIWNWHVKGIRKSGRVRQGSVCALGCPGVRDGYATSDSLASRKLDRIPSHVLDLRECSRRICYPDDCVCAGLGDGGIGQCHCGGFPDLPSRSSAVHSSSASVLIPRPIQ